MSQTPLSVELRIRPALRKASSSKSVALRADKSPEVIICWIRRSVRPRSFATSATTLSFGSSARSFIVSQSHNLPHELSLRLRENMFRLDEVYSLYVTTKMPVKRCRKQYDGGTSSESTRILFGF